MERFKYLFLKDDQLTLLNLLTKFLLDPDRINLVDFEKCSYDKFIDLYDNVINNSDLIVV